MGFEKVMYVCMLIVVRRWGSFYSANCDRWVGALAWPSGIRRRQSHSTRCSKAELKKSTQRTCTPTVISLQPQVRSQLFYSKRFKCVYTWGGPYNFLTKDSVHYLLESHGLQTCGFVPVIY